MIPLDLAEVARLTGGRLADGAAASAVVTADVVVDSRRAAPGGLFACVRGEQLDGHSFAGAAVDAGAVAVLAEHPVGVPAVVVDDTQAALAALAAAVIAASSVRVVGVTGSSGKTTTKDMLAAVFATVGETIAPENSFNNEFGLPLTVLRTTPSTRTLVLEYSARAIGHISYLCGIARPQIAIVLNVGHAHLGEFGSRAAIADAKGELVAALEPDGLAVLNADDPYVAAMASRTRARVSTFGTAPDASVRVTGLSVDALQRPSFRLATVGGDVDVQLRLHGRHQALNAAAVVAAAVGAGLPVDDVVKALEAVTDVSPHRMHLRERGDGVLVIDDAYNANPESMRAALGALAAIGAAGRRWAVLGPMRELGADTDAMHAEVGAFAAASGIDELVAVGPDVGQLVAGATATTGWTGHTREVPDADAAAAVVAAEIAPGDVVLVKASNAEQLWRVADRLLDQSTIEVRS